MEEPLRHFENKLAFETDSWDLKVALEAGENIVVVDARSPQAYQKEHIPGAINIPHRTMNQETTKQIDKASLVVTYCDGIGCNASTKGALNMTKLGFRVKELMGGLDWWNRDGYKTEGSAASTKRKRVATTKRRRITRRSTGRAKATRR
jgi:rhodanese-related sulfurtransferase